MQFGFECGLLHRREPSILGASSSNSSIMIMPRIFLNEMLAKKTVSLALIEQKKSLGTTRICPET